MILGGTREASIVTGLKRAGLSLVYTLALRARAAIWELRGATLVGVRALVARGAPPEAEVLLVRHRSGATPWALPGGGVERHERMAEAARREAYEESGAPVRVEHLLGVYDAFRGEVTNYIAVFVCAPLGEPNPPASLEISEARFFPLRALPRALDPGSRRRLGEYAAGARGVTGLW